MSETVIHVENLSKKYILGKSGGSDGLRHAIHDFVTAPLRWLKSRPSQPELRNGEKYAAAKNHKSANDFWALKDVSFEIKQGEVVGIIGRNGAGKSTLLKILSRITEPTKGRVEITGRVASLLEVGTGFHPELTGRENIFLNGAILGMSRAEIKQKFDEIVAFAEVEKFLDTPVKRYSSGMYVRLAFAVAAHLEPEILIVDEVLAVGDAQFQKKCLGKMQDVAKGGRTVLFVSHNMGTVTSLCRQAIWLHRGGVQTIGVAKQVVNEYLSLNPSNAVTVDLSSLVRGVADTRLRLQSLTWLSDIPPKNGQPLHARIEFRVESRVQNVAVGIGFSTLEGLRLLTYETDYQESFRPSQMEPGLYAVDVEIPSLPLAPTVYSLDIGCRSGDFYALDYLPAALQIEIIPGPTTPGYIVRQDAGVRLASRWSWHPPTETGAATSETTLFKT